MWPGLHAQRTPDKPALVMAGSGEVVTYRQLDEHSNRTAHLLHEAGLRFGDHIALMVENRPEFVEICWAAQRSGLYYTAVNWHFTTDEAAYIVNDCDATALFVSDAYREVAGELVTKAPRAGLKIAVGGAVDGYLSYRRERDLRPPTPPAEQIEGSPMLYSSGTTGQPKGIKYHLRREPIGRGPARIMLLTETFGMGEDTVYLSPAPLYHSAPLFYTMSVLRLGGTVVVMERFDPAEAIALIERYRVTHSQWVPTMFVRMLKLPESVRTRHDLSSHRCAIHAAAPCPVDVKRAMIEWWGPIVEEYYAATEGLGMTRIDSREWLAHPGSVGRSMLAPVRILDEDGRELPAGEVGTVWFEPPGRHRSFEYHKDEAKTAEAHDEHGRATVGDMGYLDEDGYLYLTDRRTFMIVSGGVNVYPQEAENVLVTHPEVFDAAVFGIPDEEMGERVHAVVQPTDMSNAGPELERKLLEFCRSRLAHYKCPRAIDFEAELPRQPTGKLYKRLLRDRYWGRHGSRIV